jgi:hypothetical protein
MAARASRPEAHRSGIGAPFLLLKPMCEFDPYLPAFVHDRRNDPAFLWSPKWANRYERCARKSEHGAVEFDGLLLDGWSELREGKAS